MKGCLRKGKNAVLALFGIRMVQSTKVSSSFFKKSLKNDFKKWFLIGDWKHDVRHGFGAYYYPNGDLYEGHWHRGVKEGLGTYTWAESKEFKFLGIWKKGRMEGPGQIIHDKHRYHGNFTLNMVETLDTIEFVNYKLFHII